MEAETSSHEEAETVVDTLADRVTEAEVEKHGNTPDDLEAEAVVDTLDNTS